MMFLQMVDNKSSKSNRSARVLNCNKRALRSHGLEEVDSIACFKVYGEDGGGTITIEPRGVGEATGLQNNSCVQNNQLSRGSKLVNNQIPTTGRDGKWDQSPSVRSQGSSFFLR